MPKKCEECRHYKPSGLARGFWNGFCASPTILNIREVVMSNLSIRYAREICDREGDGIFVHFEPKCPTAGACFVQITRGRPTQLVAVVDTPDWRRQLCNLLQSRVATNSNV